jgi:uncharacterized protein YndB with AHSA1/START domain
MSTDTAPARVTHLFDTSPERVFDAWLDPTRAPQWMFVATMRDELVRVSIDARVGGRFSFVVRRDGQELDHNGKYFEIDRPRRLAFSWGVGEDSTQGSRVTITIAPRAHGGCELTLTHNLAPEWSEYAARTEQGWTTILDALSDELRQPG